MRIGEGQGGCVPNAAQVLALKACVWEPAGAIAAWQEWMKSNTLDVVDEALFRQMPLLYWNLNHAGYDGAEMPLLKGVARRSWYTNQLIFRAIAALCQQLNDAGAPPLLLKGLAYSQLYYPEPFVRCMNDGDIMVATDKLDATLSVMLKSGWRPNVPVPDDFRHSLYALTLINPQMQELDVHWRLMEEWQGDHTGLWQRARPLPFMGVATQTLSDTDHLMHACLHGYRWNPLHPMRWVADACLILKSAGERISWGTLLAEAGQQNLSYRLYKALKFLRETMHASVPGSVLMRLACRPIGISEHRAHLAACRETIDYAAMKQRLKRLVFRPFRQAS